MKRSVYVLDAGNGSSNTVILHVYTRTDTITSRNGQLSDVATVVPHHQVVLSLASAVGSTCYMAANDTSIFISNGANTATSKKTFVETVFQNSTAFNSGFVTQKGVRHECYDRCG